MAAVDNLEDVKLLPGRWHELKGQLKHCLSVDLDHPYRLIFKVADEPAPTKPDGGLDWSAVTVLKVQSIRDTHE